MYQDYKDLLSAFRSHGVKYLVVGGFAVIYHSQPRFTGTVLSLQPVSQATRRAADIPDQRQVNSGNRRVGFYGKSIFG